MATCRGLYDPVQSFSGVERAGSLAAARDRAWPARHRARSGRSARTRLRPPNLHGARCNLTGITFRASDCRRSNSQGVAKTIGLGIDHRQVMPELVRARAVASAWMPLDWFSCWRPLRLFGRSFTANQSIPKAYNGGTALLNFP